MKEDQLLLLLYSTTNKGLHIFLLNMSNISVLEYSNIFLLHSDFGQMSIIIFFVYYCFSLKKTKKKTPRHINRCELVWKIVSYITIKLYFH